MDFHDFTKVIKQSRYQFHPPPKFMCRAKCYRGCSNWIGKTNIYVWNVFFRIRSRSASLAEPCFQVSNVVVMRSSKSGSEAISNLPNEKKHTHTHKVPRCGGGSKRPPDVAPRPFQKKPRRGPFCARGWVVWVFLAQCCSSKHRSCNWADFFSYL